jgi:2-isopropylmalate synthase
VFVSPRRIHIFDTTLRDGGAVLRPHEKAELAVQLERLRVDVIEAGSATDLDGLRAVAAAVSGPTVAALARPHEIDAAGDALAGARRSRIHLSLPPGEDARAPVQHALARADEVEVSFEDATSCDPGFVAHACGVAVAAGATVIGLPDTAGYALPRQYAAFLAEVRRRRPELRDVALSVHCHNDLGLAVANSLAGVGAGASQVHCTVNGIGERAGNASLEEVVVALRVRGEYFNAATSVETSELTRASRLVARRTGCVVQPNKAVVGANAFAHEAGIHQDGMLKDERTYQIIDPAEVGVRMTLPLGKHSGRHAFARACAERGVELMGEDLNAAFRRFKALADSGRQVVLEDVLEGVPA